MGVCYEEMKQFDKAIEIFEQTLEINPQHASAVFGLARALQRTGHTAEAREQFKRFQHLTSTKISSPSGGVWRAGTLFDGDRDRRTADNERAMIPVQLMVQPLVAPASADPAPWTTTGGACMIDVTGAGTDGLGADASRRSGDSRAASAATETLKNWMRQATGLKADGRAVACAVGDYDGDGLNDLAIALDDRVLLFRNLGHGKFEDETAKSGITPLNRPTGITFVDYDHDGDLDLFLTGAALKPGGQSNVLWRNNGDGTFTEQTEATGLGGSGKTAAAIVTDFNNDRAVDLAVTGDGPSPVLYVNPREGKYPEQPLYESAKLPATVGIAVLDYNKDGWMDIAVTHAGAPGLTLWRNGEGPDHIERRFERVALPLSGAVRGWGLTAVDIDNDGWIDLAAIVEATAGRG